MRRVVEPDIAHAELPDDEEAAEAETVAVEAHRVLEVVHVHVDVADAGAGRHGGLEHRPVAELADEAVEVDGLAAGMRLALGGGGIGAGFGIAQGAAPGRLEGDLDAVAVEVPQIDRLGDEVVGGRDAHAALQGAHGELREVAPRRDVDGDVVEAGGARHDRPHGAGLEHDQHPAADAEAERVARLGHEVEADHVAPHRQRLVAVGDGDVHRAEAGGERQRRSAADLGLGLDGEDHLRLRVAFASI